MKEKWADSILSMYTIKLKPSVFSTLLRVIVLIRIWNCEYIAIINIRTLILYYYSTLTKGIKYIRRIDQSSIQT